MANILNLLKKAGYPAALVSISRVRELREGLDGLLRGGLLDEVFYKERLSWFDFGPPAALPGARTIIVAAAPQPQLTATFHPGETALKTVIPPTYDYAPNGLVQRILAEALSPSGFSACPTRLPLKILAARAGLGVYGRNNILYIPGLGSFVRLMAFFTDAPGEGETWGEPAMMEACRACSACLRACPTGAVSGDRFIIRAEKCLTYQNERPGDFPAWVDPSWHNCLMGCMACQRVCPEDRDVRGWYQGAAEFDEEETGWVLESKPFLELPPETKLKFDSLGLAEDYGLLARNLKVLLPPTNGR